MRWANERQFDGAIEAAVEAVNARVRPELVYAIIAVESGFDPRVVRGEPQIDSASVGLMQVLGTTARRLGYGGPIGNPMELSGLFDPATNVTVGVRYLDWVLGQVGGDEDAAASAYNGGYRPQLGFGGRRTTATPTVCLQWRPSAPTSGRSLARDCAVLGSTIPGTFSNQRYVDRVKDAAAYFFARGPAPGAPAPGPVAPVAPVTVAPGLVAPGTGAWPVPAAPVPAPTPEGRVPR